MDFPQRIGLVKSLSIDFPKNRKIYPGPDSITIENSSFMRWFKGGVRYIFASLLFMFKREDL